MEKITEKRAEELLKQGFFPECEVERDTFIKVKSLSELANLKNLANMGVQSFTLYGFSNQEISSFKKIPADSIEVSFEDAAEVLEIKGDIYGKILGVKETFQIESINDLKSFYVRHRNDYLLYYWYSK